MFHPGSKKDEKVVYHEINDSVPLTFFEPTKYSIVANKLSIYFVKLSSTNIEDAPSDIKNFVSGVSNIKDNPIFKQYINVTPTFQTGEGFHLIKIPPGNHEETTICLRYYRDTIDKRTYITFNRFDGCAFVFSLVYHIILLVCDKFLEEEFRCKDKDLENAIKGYESFHPIIRQ